MYLLKIFINKIKGVICGIIYILGGGISMRHFYSEIDKVTLTFSDIYIIEDIYRYIYLRFERPNEVGFDFAETSLPNLNWSKTYGFSEMELYDLEQYARDNAPLIWRVAQEEGEVICRP